MTLTWEVEQVLKRVALGISRWPDADYLRDYIKQLHQRLADAEDRARREAQPVNERIMPMCGVCGHALEHVKFDKYQCNHCEQEQHA